MHVDTGGGRIEVSAEGDGPPLTLIHGLGSSLDVWDAVAAPLAVRFRVIRYDLRGHGGSTQPPGPYSLDNLTADLRAVLAASDITRTHLAGFSLGGLIAQSFALSQPESIDRLIVISAAANKSPGEIKRLKERADEMDRHGIETANLDALVDRWFTTGFRATHPDVVGGRLQRYRETDRDALAGAFRAFIEGDLGARLHEITTPTLIMTGENDPISTADMARFMHREINGSALHILPGLRHSVLLEAPQLVADRMAAFLSKADA